MRYRTHRLFTTGVAALASAVLIATGVPAAGAAPASAGPVAEAQTDTAKRSIAREMTLEAGPVGGLENNARRYRITAHLTSADPGTGHGIAGQVVTFNVNGPASGYTVDAVTDAGGFATIHHVVAFTDAQALASGVHVTATVDHHYEDNAVYGPAQAEIVVPLTGDPVGFGSSGPGFGFFSDMLANFHRMFGNFFAGLFGANR
ncbi:hypothetical protein [Corynebacterium antarcticum]|uniref:hypothetical protein n=1 Tax=Corynebacterium antarcticum TaxID=2800405 RepID=UPI00200485E1|nr:hypothetical protein [Corynebacterium antarcticum]MCK7641451.1 hypothetical protein [Corynebacterium antarcticum]MCK7660451.1 hypothetical protein [Corynebacterium antarcticum]MCX7491052.1 hypothetical protein [Corynebacterium antarcticum]